MPQKAVDDYDIETEILPYLPDGSAVEGNNGSYQFYCPLHDDIGTQWKGFSLNRVGRRNLGKCHSCGSTLKDLIDWIESGGEANGQIKVNVRPVSNGKKKAEKETRPRAKRQRGMDWWVAKTQVPREVWEEMGCDEHANGVAFLFEGLEVAKIRRPPKEIEWINTENYEAPPLWPVPEDELPEHIWINEGESDAGTARAAGFRAYATTKGAKGALPPGTFEALRSRGVTEVTLCGDADESGHEFSTREASAAVDAGLEVNVVRLSEVCDPLFGINDLNGVWREADSEAHFLELITKCTHRVRSRYAIRTADEWEALVNEEIPWIIPDLLTHDDKVMVSGPPKAYKTYLILDLARSLTTCTPFMQRAEWTPKEPVTMMLVEEEGSEHQWARRLKRAGLLNGNPFICLHRHGISFADPTTIDEIIQICRERKVQVLAFDPLQRMIPGLEENSASEMAKVWDQVMRIQQACPGICVIIVHHTRKDDDSERGSGRHRGEVDLRVSVRKDDYEENTMQVRLEGRDVAVDLGPDEYFQAKVSISDDSLTIDAREIVVNVNKPKMTRMVNKDKVLAAIEEGCRTRTSIASQTSLSDNTVIKILEQLVGEGEITEHEHGKGKAKTYERKESE